MSGKSVGGGMTYTRQIPNFLQAMAAKDDSGIDGAVRRAEKMPEREEREDNEEERPVVVDEEDAVVHSKAKGKAGGSLRFKGDEASAASKFCESAFERVMQAEREQAAPPPPSDAIAEASGKMVFSSAGAAKAKKRKADRAGGVSAGKALKNTKLLSFEEED